MAEEYSKTGLYRISWTGDRSTIIGQLQGINNKLLETNKTLNDLKLLATMIVDNTNCACEELKKLNIKPEPPVEVFPVLAYAENHLIAHSQGSKYTFYYISYVKSLDSQNKPADFLIKNPPADWVEDVAITVLNPDDLKDNLQIVLGFTHKVTYGVLGSDTPDERRTEIPIKQLSSDLEDVLVIEQFLGYNDPKFFWNRSKTDNLDLSVMADGLPVGLHDHKPSASSRLAGNTFTPFTAVSISESWVTVVVVGEYCNFTFEPNVYGVSRNAYVVFEQTETGKRIECRISQAPESYILRFVGGGNAREVEFLAGGSLGFDSFDFISTNGSGEILSLGLGAVPDWLDVIMLDGTILFGCKPNSGSFSREAPVIFSQYNSRHELVIYFSQPASIFEWKNFGDSISLEVPLVGFSDSLILLSKDSLKDLGYVVDYNGSDSDSWLKFVQTGPTDVSISVYPSSSAREAVVLFIQNDTGRVVSCTVSQTIV